MAIFIMHLFGIAIDLTALKRKTNLMHPIGKQFLTFIAVSLLL